MIRLHIPQPLTAQADLAPTPDQSRYLTQVMRLKIGDQALVFNGVDGEWRCSLTEIHKRGVILRAETRVRGQIAPADVRLLLATLKKSALEFAIEKATELGAIEITLVQTARTQPHHVRMDRLAAIAEESAEQTGRLEVPQIRPPRRLEDILDSWEPSRRLMFCDEAGGLPALSALRTAGEGPWSILIGPEGGFSPEERQRLRALPFATAVNLGPRILRADTAVATALALWQAALGDWER
jgi:16S rRNA (uracil1498-N3)-methyltransferase